jgi:hypothetical protein
MKIITAAALIITATTATAELKCDPRDQMTTMLTQKYSEHVTGDGIVEVEQDGESLGSAIAEVWHNPDTGSFSFTMTGPTGITCIVFYGTSWQTNAIIDQPQGSKS